MSEPMIIPPEFQRAFHRLMNRVASEDRNDPELQKSILVYLKNRVTAPSRAFRNPNFKGTKKLA